MSLLGLMVFGFGTAFVNTFNQYLFFRFGVSQALVGYTISSVSLGEAQPWGCCEGWREGGGWRGTGGGAWKGPGPSWGWGWGWLALTGTPQD